MVTVPVKVTFNFDEEDPQERKKKKTSSDESSTSDESSVGEEDRLPPLEGEESQKRTAGFNDEPTVQWHVRASAYNDRFSAASIIKVTCQRPLESKQCC